MYNGNMSNPMPLTPHPCACGCGRDVPIKPTDNARNYARRRYASSMCRGKAPIARQEPRKCARAGCPNVFAPKRASNIYCSPTCQHNSRYDTGVIPGDAPRSGIQRDGAIVCAPDVPVSVEIGREPAADPRFW